MVCGISVQQHLLLEYGHILNSIFWQAVQKAENRSHITFSHALLGLFGHPIHTSNTPVGKDVNMLAL